MTAIPENVATLQDLVTWNAMQEQLSKLKAEEMALRRRIFATFFPTPKEGTNSYPLAQGWVLKATHGITRDVDIGAFTSLKESFLAAGIKADSMVQFKPSLVTKEYRTLTAEQNQLFDQCLIVKPSSPSLEIVLPAKAKKAGE